MAYGTLRNETKRNGTCTLRNGTLRNSTLRNGTLRNGTLQNGTLRNSSVVAYSGAMVFGLDSRLSHRVDQHKCDQKPKSK